MNVFSLQEISFFPIAAIHRRKPSPTLRKVTATSWMMPAGTSAMCDWWSYIAEEEDEVPILNLGFGPNQDLLSSQVVYPKLSHISRSQLVVENPLGRAKTEVPPFNFVQ